MYEAIKQTGIVFLGLIILSSCSIEKRKYLSGYYVDKNSHVSGAKIMCLIHDDRIVNDNQKSINNYLIKEKESVEENLTASLEKTTNVSGNAFSISPVISEKLHSQMNTTKETNKVNTEHLSHTSKAIDIVVKKTKKNEMYRKNYKTVKQKYSGHPSPGINMLLLILFILSLITYLISWVQNGFHPFENFDWNRLLKCVIAFGLLILCLLALGGGRFN